MSAREHRAEHAELVAPYLLGALSELEAQAFAAHLRACPQCQQDVERLRLVVDALGTTPEPRTPPPELRPAVLAAVRAETEVRRATTPARTWTPRRPARGVVAVAAAAVVALVAGVAGFALGREGAGERRTITARVDDERLPGATGRLVESDGEAVLRLAGLPAPGRDRAYAVWVRRDGETTPVSLVRPLGTGTAIAGLGREYAGADAVLVTRESDADVRAPTEAPVVSVRVDGS